MTNIYIATREVHEGSVILSVHSSLEKAKAKYPNAIWKEEGKAWFGKFFTAPVDAYDYDLMIHAMELD